MYVCNDDHLVTENFYQPFKLLTSTIPPVDM